MSKAWVIAGLAAVLVGCVTRSSAWKGGVEWPDASSTPQVIPAVEAGATLAAAAAIREMVRENPFPDLFRGCSSPEQGLDVAVFKDPKSGLYYVVLHQHFSRCGGPLGRVLDWWYEYAVTAQGEVVGKAPPESAESPEAAPPQRMPWPLPVPVPVPASGVQSTEEKEASEPARHEPPRDSPE
ncbi:hypothetical protein [Archangium sp.]|uniref:hypothetical protein n=1 Tax=Archangium sp. TaxID=1872627 RepID=UPI00286B8773|nr:hypothetical protein [Archangium sp.]